MAGLELACDELVKNAVKGELWIDGGFLTQSINPRDADVVLCGDGSFYDNASYDQRAKIDWFNGNLKATHFCDSYVFLEYPQGHVHYQVGQQMRAYWTKQFGFSRAGIYKGISVITL